MTLLLSLLKREIKRVSDPVVLDIPGLEHSISLQYSEEELLHSLNKTDIATFVIQLYSIFSKTH